jgi:hypothetical protein
MIGKTALVLMLMLLSVSILGIGMRPTAAQPLDPLIWGPYTRLSYTLTETRWAMVATNERYDPNYIVVVFTDNLTGQFDWYFTKSTDGGATWTTPQIAVNPDFDVMETELYCAAIAMDDNGIVHMSFARQKTWWPRDTAPTGIYYARYDGTSWSAPIPIYENLSPGYLWVGVNDIIIGRNNMVHLAYGSDYLGNDNGDIWYCRSEDGGLTWSSPININAFDWMDTGPVTSLGTDDFGYVYYACGDDWYNSAWTGETYFRRSQDDGATWDPQMAITRRENGDRCPRLMCDNAGGVYVVWNGYPSPNLLLFKYSTDHGSNWTPYYGGITLMEDVPGMGIDYFAELDDYGFIHIVYSSTATGTTETYYMRIDTSGNIVVPSQIITPDDGYPSYPTGLALTGDQVCVVTKDLKDGNWEAYFLGLPLTYYELTVTSSPTTGITFTIDGVPQTTPYTGWLPEGSYAVVMPSTHDGDAMYYWDQWNDGNTSRSRTVTMTENITLTAYYTGPYYELTVNSSPIAGISFTINGTPQTTPYSEWFLEGSYTLIMPETHNDYVWSHWLEDGDPSRTKMIILTGSTTWTGVFEFAVPPYGPTAEFTVTPETANVGESVKFDASSSQSGWNGTHERPVIEYHWDFGDGNETTTSTPTIYHSFTSFGNYYVTLTVYAPGATPETATATHKVTVVSVPVGGYSYPITGHTTTTPLTLYLVLTTIIASVFITIKRKTPKRKGHS